MGYGVGRTGAGLIVSFTKIEAIVHVQIDNSLHPDWFSSLEANQSEIENSLGFQLEWEKREDKKYAYVLIKRSTDMTDPENWPDAFAWMASKMDAMRSVFRPIVGELPEG